MLSRVTWSICLSYGPAKCRRSCARCGAVTRFTSSGCFRVNANGKRVDVWLIYNCEGCGRSWNAEILERAPVRGIDPELLDGYLHNDPGLARCHELDAARLGRQGAVMESVEFQLRPSRRVDLLRPASPLEITLRLPDPIVVRLDRVLSEGLGLSRGNIRALAAARCIRVEGASGRRALARQVSDGQKVLYSGCS